MKLAIGILAATALLTATASPSVAAPPLAKIAPEAAGFSAERLKSLDETMAKAVSNGEVAGISTLLIRHDKEVAFHSWGKRDLASGAPMTRDTIFRIFSMTKPVTGVAMMILFEQGKWKLDDAVTKFIPELKDLKVMTGVDSKGRPILVPMKRPPTMRELMSHTAGFGYGLDRTNPADRMFLDQNVLLSEGLDQLVAKVAKIPLLYQPGEHWSYSVAVDLQGYIVERISGQKFGRFLEDHIFRPLKMADTGFFVPKDKVSRFAVAYRADPETGKLVDVAGQTDARSRDFTRPPPFESGGGGLVSTIDDYARFCLMLANGGELDGVRILAPATVELMRTSVLPAGVVVTPPTILNDAIGFGLDFMVIADPRKAGRLEGKGTMSWEGAAGTHFWVDPTNDVIYIAMLQNFNRAGPVASYDPMARPLVYQALIDPAK